MSERTPDTETLSIAELGGDLRSLVGNVSQQQVRVIVEENGAPVAALVSIDDLRRWMRFERDREERFAVIDRMREAFADIPAEEIEEEVSRAVAEVREEMATERRNRPLAS
jgi:prevent-host-death family protein